MTTIEKRTRNWQKARLTGFNLDPSVMSVMEQLMYSQIRDLKNQLLHHWDNNTESLIGHPLPPHKCSWCGKRSNMEYKYEDMNYCSKHFNEYYAEQRQIRTPIRRLVGED